jgi:hypothetical protein
MPRRQLFASPSPSPSPFQCPSKRRMRWLHLICLTFVGGLVWLQLFENPHFHSPTKAHDVVVSFENTNKYVNVSRLMTKGQHQQQHQQLVWKNPLSKTKRTIQNTDHTVSSIKSSQTAASFSTSEKNTTTMTKKTKKNLVLFNDDALVRHNHMNNSLPFYIHPMCNPRIDMNRGGNLSPLLHHPMRKEWNSAILAVTEEEQDHHNSLIILCHRDKTKLAQKLANELPVRTIKSPYVVSAHGLSHDKCSQNFDASCQAWFDLWSSSSSSSSSSNHRSDILYFALDRTDHRLCDDSGLSTLPGVAMAPPATSFRQTTTTSKTAMIPTTQNKRYLVSFAGTNHEGYYGSSMVRPWLFRSYQNWVNQTTENHGDDDDVLITELLTTPSEYKDLLRQSKFGFVPRGDGRWNFRLYDLIEFGVIPVFLADGYEPPFAPLIRWELASVTFPETQAKDLETIVSRLRRFSNDDVEQMARSVQEIRTRCFRTAKARVDCLLQSLSILVVQQQQQQQQQNTTAIGSTVSVAERMRMPLCPRREMETHSGDVLYENNTFSSFQTLY